MVRKMEKDLWEIRTTLSNRKCRVFFTVWESYLILLHGFIKKDQKTPKEDLSIARKRRDDVLGGDKK
ncbi:type II toxin-antitoxin system RelE/ParE family toxin [Salinispira pacifica]|uniref:type II toxin-antitoxin system RelE/ParE family toxin n=1 Tax=Salinispira pacifica TaxID=1307761 RepID=UPI003CC70EBE